MPPDDPPSIHYTFVDEAGDTTLFSRRGNVLVGTPGCSYTFMLGLARLPDPHGAATKLEALRKELLADPYFKNVPSMQPEAAKTALYFHAKDDLPEVRREVFKLIGTLNAEVLVAIRRKSLLVEIAQKARRLGGTTLFGPGHLYDDLVRRLFRTRLHKADQHHIVFSKRGKSTRIRSLAAALNKAKKALGQHGQSGADDSTVVSCLLPSQSCGLQVIDYYLWALQRMIERQESRFFESIRADYRLIMDLDDQRNKPYGEWYDRRNPFTLDKMKAL